jgi:hypothetical protein
MIPSMPTYEAAWHILDAYHMFLTDIDPNQPHSEIEDTAEEILSEHILTVPDPEYFAEVWGMRSYMKQRDLERSL